MNIMITGASGFVGKSIIKALSVAGHTGLAISRRPITGLPDGWIWLDRQCVLLNGLEEGLGLPDWVIHLEVKQHVINPSPADCAEFTSVNVEGTRQWLVWCERVGVSRFIYFSTIKAVGDSQVCQDENANSQPTTPYGRSKREAEKIVRAWTLEKPVRIAFILRPAVIYGPGNRANVFAMVDAVARGRFFVVGGGGNIKSLVSVTNVAAAVEFILREDQVGCHIYNVVDRESHTVEKLAMMLANEMFGKRKVRSLPFWFASAIASLGDSLMFVGIRFPLTSTRLKALVEVTNFSCTKLLSKGFLHPQSTEVGLAEMVRWYRGTR